MADEPRGNAYATLDLLHWMIRAGNPKGASAMSTVTGAGLATATMEWTSRFEPESPFAEVLPEVEDAASMTGFTPWAENFSPFAEGASPTTVGAEAEAEFEEMLAELRDEAFHEAIVGLVAETEEAVGDRFNGEGPLAIGADQERLAEAHLAPVQFEAEQHLEHLSSGLAGMDIESLNVQQLDEVLARLDPGPSQLSPAGEDFLGSLVRKAKRVVKGVGRVAARVGKAAGGLALRALKRLKGLIRPLLRRVLSMAINRLPAPLRPAATAVARRLGLPAAAEAEAENMSPAVPVDSESLAESFDAALSEAVLSGEDEQGTPESFAGEYQDDPGPADRRLEALAESRSELIDRFGRAADGEDLAPAVEQFVPALLGVLRMGIRVVGRPKVVNFLARYLSRLIKPWVGPAVAAPLSSAVVDTGLRLISLEARSDEGSGAEAAPALLAATVEDTVRRLAESEEYVFEDEDLLQLAVSEAFEQAVASTFPAQFVRSDLQAAPTVGGSFIPRHPRRAYNYLKYSRVPEIELTPQVASGIRTFGGTTLAAALQAAGRRVPVRVRVHVFEATAGTRLPKLTRLERGVQGLGTPKSWSHLHPLTPEAAGLLLREPKLGVAVTPVYMRSRHRIAAGQRFYYLEPIEAAASPQPSEEQGSCRAPTQGWLSIDLIRSQITLAIYLSEVESQAISAAINQGRGPAALLKALSAAYDGVARSFEHTDGRIKIIKELEEGEEFLGPILRRISPALLQPLRRKVQEWVMRTLAEWTRGRAPEFSRAAADPACGVTVTVRLSAVPGLHTLRQALNGQLGIAALRGLAGAGDFRGAPSSTVTVAAGQHRP